MDDPMQDRDNWGWQATATSMRERTSYLWKNHPIPTNVTFAVGSAGQKELIGAHRDILAISSEVFYSMFYGPLVKTRDQNEAIVDDDIDPEAFRLMLKFVYTESIAQDVDGHRTEPFPTGVELAFKTMQAAGKFGIPALYLFCRNYILDDIQKTFTTSKDAAEDGILCAVYARNAEWYNKPIITAVWREIDAFAEVVLKVSDQVLQVVDEALVMELLTRTSLNVSREIMLYDFAVRWARLQQEGPRKNETLKKVMENLCKVLRFSLMSEQEWLDGPVKDGLCALDELERNTTLVNDTIQRSVHDPPAIIQFEIFEAKEICEAEWERFDDLGQVKIQTQTEDNPVLTKLVEKCVRKQMKRNNSDSMFDLAINLLYMNYHISSCGRAEGCDVIPNLEELDMLNNGGRIASQMKLGLGDVAVGFQLREGDHLIARLDSMFLVFGEHSLQLSSGYLHDIHEAKLFYLGRLTTGQDFLDNWARGPHGGSISYEVTYNKKTLDTPAKDKDDLSDCGSDSDVDF